MSRDQDGYALWFTPRSAYTICPHKWTYRLSLSYIDHRVNLMDVVEMAEKRGGYSLDYSGILHVSEGARAGQMRFWRIQWTDKTGPHGKVRHFHFPEADYLATLVARLQIAGELAAVERVRQLAVAPLPKVTLLPTPDPYELSNYTFNKWFTIEIRHSVRLILDQRDFALARQRVERREGYMVADGSRVEYREPGVVRLHLQRGHTHDVEESLYRELVEKLPQEVARWTAPH